MVWHRFLAIPSCLFFGIWFVSGIVMMYARMPELTEAARLDRLPPLDLKQAQVAPQNFPDLASHPERITVGMLNGRPVYRVLRAIGTWSSVYADNGQKLEGIDPASAVKATAQFSGQNQGQLTWVGELTDVDQWTVYPSSRVFLPFEMVEAHDPQSTKYYVSGATGSIYLSTTLRSRLLAWCGAIPHWWYIRSLRANTPLWRIVMIVASAWGVLMCGVGIIAGVMRYSPSKRYKFPGPRYSSVPHVGTKRWHYVLGYGFGFITFTWILSGLFSMNPGKWSPGPEPSTSEIHAFAGSVLDISAFKVDTKQALGLLQKCIRPKELELLMFNGNPYYLGRESADAVRLISARGDSAECISQIPFVDLVAASRRAVANADVIDAVVLNTYDSYYYDRKHQKPLPIVRLRMADTKQTWLYINPRTAMIQARYTDRSRWERWLYNGLHSLDFPFLYYHRPIWDLTVIFLSVGGFVLSATGIILTKRYLQKSFKKRRESLRWS